MHTVSLSANFEQNLAEIAHYLDTAQLNNAGLNTAAAQPAYMQLLDTLSTKVIVDLAQFPEIGRKYLERQQQSVEAIAMLTQIENLCPPDELRQYRLNDYLVLYINRSNTIYLLAIRHQRQLAFKYTQS
jgi:plasmid stabilization system protein ParE